MAPHVDGWPHGGCCRLTSGTRRRAADRLSAADYGVADNITARLLAVAGGASVRQDACASLPGIVLPPGNGREERNREGYYQTFWGWESAFFK